MKPQVWLTLARGVVLESIRRKDLWVVLILGFLIVLSAGTLGFFGLDGLDAFAKDLGLTVLGMFSTILAILGSSRLLPEELKNRTLYPLLSRPISRFDLLFGKLLGSYAVTAISFTLLAAVTCVALAIFRVHFEPIMLQYFFCKLLGLWLVCTLGLFLSAVMTPSAAATLCFILTFGSTMIVRALVLAVQSGTGGNPALLKVINAIIPQFGLFDLSGRAANSNWGTVPAWVVLALVVYFITYSTGLFTFTWLKFRKQAI